MGYLSPQIMLVVQKKVIVELRQRHESESKRRKGYHFLIKHFLSFDAEQM
jgi:hypothetical protein